MGRSACPERASRQVGSNRQSRLSSITHTLTFAVEISVMYMTQKMLISSLLGRFLRTPRFAKVGRRPPPSLPAFELIIRHLLSVYFVCGVRLLVWSVWLACDPRLSVVHVACCLSLWT